MNKIKLMPFQIINVPAPLSSVWSPDGSLIAIGTWKNLFVMDSKGNTLFKQNASYGIRSIAFSPDSKSVAFADGHVIYLFPFEKPEKEITLTSHVNSVLSLVFDPTGKILASAGEDNQIVLWDIASPGNKTIVHSKKPPVRGLDFTSDSKYLFSSSESNGINKWNVTSQVEESGLDCQCNGTTRLLTISDYLIVGTTDGWIQIWDYQNSSMLHRIDAETGIIQSLSVNNSGTNIFWSGMDGRIGVITNLLTGEYRLLPTLIGIVGSVSPNQDGSKIVASGSNYSVVILDSITGTILQTLYTGSSFNVSSFSYSPDGDYILIKSKAFANNRLFRWSIANSVYQVVAPFSNIIGGGFDDIPWTFFPNGDMVFYNGQNQSPLGVLDLTTGDAKVIKNTSGNEMIVDVSTDQSGKYLAWIAVVNGVYGYNNDPKHILSLMDFTKQTIIHQWDIRNYWKHSYEYIHVALLSNQTIISPRPDGLWSFLVSKENPDLIYNGSFFTVELSSDETMLAAVVAYPVPYKVQGHIEIFALANGGQSIVRKQRIIGEAISFSPNGDLIAVLYGGRIQIMDTTSYKTLLNIAIPGESLLHVEFSPAGNSIAALSDHGNVYLWGIPANTH